MKKTFTVSWRDEVYRFVDIEAESKEEAFELWSKGKYEGSMADSCNTLSTKEEIMDDMEEE